MDWFPASEKPEDGRLIVTLSNDPMIRPNRRYNLTTASSGFPFFNHVAWWAYIDPPSAMCENKHD
jgi:hypothetical protein